MAYGEIGVARQRLLHARVAAALEARHAGDLASQWGALAVHYREGLVWDKALEFLRAAASQAAARGAYREAAVLFDEALAAGTHLGDSPGARGHAIEIHVELRDLFQTQAERTRAAGRLAEADRLARALRDDRRRAFVLNSSPIRHGSTDTTDRPSSSAASSRRWGVCSATLGSKDRAT